MISHCINFFLQLFALNMSQTWVSADYSKFVLIFLFLNKKLETFLQINFTDNFACTINTILGYTFGKEALYFKFSKNHSFSNPSGHKLHKSNSRLNNCQVHFGFRASTSFDVQNVQTSKSMTISIFKHWDFRYPRYSIWIYYVNPNNNNKLHPKWTHNNVGLITPCSFMYRDRFRTHKFPYPSDNAPSVYIWAWHHPCVSWRSYGTKGLTEVVGPNQGEAYRQW
jgi:hypothetical protein